MEPSIFTRIINGEIPCHKIYEDDKTIAFLDIHPDKPGHTLVVTKTQIDQYIDLSDQDYTALWGAVKKVATQLKGVLHTDRVKVVIVGTDIPHVHVHLIPFNEDDKASNHDRDNQEPDHTALAEMAEKLAF
jgi:histidine triad (HIT) family protein